MTPKLDPNVFLIAAEMIFTRATFNAAFAVADSCRDLKRRGMRDHLIFWSKIMGEAEMCYDDNQRVHLLLLAHEIAKDGGL